MAIENKHSTTPTTIFICNISLIELREGGTLVNHQANVNVQFSVAHNTCSWGFSCLIQLSRPAFLHRSTSVIMLLMHESTGVFFSKSLFLIIYNMVFAHYCFHAFRTFIFHLRRLSITLYYGLLVKNTCKSIHNIRSLQILHIIFSASHFNIINPLYFFALCPISSSIISNTQYQYHNNNNTCCIHGTNSKACVVNYK